MSGLSSSEVRTILILNRRRKTQAASKAIFEIREAAFVGGNSSNCVG
jgi:hypothetical protein